MAQKYSNLPPEFLNQFCFCHGENALRSIGIEHSLNLIRIIRFGQAQRQQQARFPRLQVITRDEAALGQPGAAHDAA